MIQFYKLNLEAKNVPTKWEFGLAWVYKGWNGEFWIRNLDLPICVTGCHTDG